MVRVYGKSVATNHWGKDQLVFTSPRNVHTFNPLREDLWVLAEDSF